VGHRWLGRVRASTLLLLCRGVAQFGGAAVYNRSVWLACFRVLPPLVTIGFTVLTVRGLQAENAGSCSWSSQDDGLRCPMLGIWFVFGKAAGWGAMKKLIMLMTIAYMTSLIIFRF
jgi:hypothetical protein